MPTAATVDFHGRVNVVTKALIPGEVEVISLKRQIEKLAVVQPQLPAELLSAENPGSLANDDELIGLDVRDFSVAPFGHRIVRSADFAAPSPKCRRRSFAE